MNKKWIELAGKLLDEAADKYADHICNDWDFPKDWTVEDKQEIVKAMHVDNGSAVEYNEHELNVPDWWIMAFLAKKLKELANDNENR